MSLKIENKLKYWWSVFGEYIEKNLWLNIRKSQFLFFFWFCRFKYHEDIKMSQEKPLIVLRSIWETQSRYDSVCAP